MRAAVLYIFWILMMFGGHNIAAPVHHAPAGSAHLASSGSTQQWDHTLFKSIYLNTESEYLIAETREDEENTSNTVVRKFKLLTRYQTLAACFELLSRRHAQMTAHTPTGRSLPCIYLEQSVLRI
jgi:hypothetical protein